MGYDAEPSAGGRGSLWDCLDWLGAEDDGGGSDGDVEAGRSESEGKSAQAPFS